MNFFTVIASVLSVRNFLKANESDLKTNNNQNLDNEKVKIISSKIKDELKEILTIIAK